MVEGEFVTFAVLFEGITTTSMQLLHVTNQGFMPRARNLKKQFSLVFKWAAVWSGNNTSVAHCVKFSTPRVELLKLLWADKL